MLSLHFHNIKIILFQNTLNKAGSAGELSCSWRVPENVTLRKRAQCALNEYDPVWHDPWCHMRTTKPSDFRCPACSSLSALPPNMTRPVVSSLGTKQQRRAKATASLSVFKEKLTCSKIKWCRPMKTSGSLAWPGFEQVALTDILTVTL